MSNQDTLKKVQEEIADLVAKYGYSLTPDQILSIKGILIECEDNQLPETEGLIEHEFVGTGRGVIVDIGSYQKKAQQNMLSAGFIKAFRAEEVSHV